MTALRQAAQQALEALEFLSLDFFMLDPISPGREEGNKAIIALRAALAEPVQEPVQEPVAYSVGRTLHWHDGKGMNDAQLYLAPPQRKPEPVALDWLHKWANQDDGEPETQWHEGYEAARRVVQIHLTAPPQRPADPVQEPVAWMHTDPDNPRVKFLVWRENEPAYCGVWIKTPLYAAPPQRKPLTEEEIQELSRTMVKGDRSVNWLCRAIERAHGIT